MARTHQKQKKNEIQKKTRITQYIVIASVIVIAAALLFIKQTQRKSAAEAIPDNPPLSAAAEEVALMPNTDVAVSESLEERIDRLQQNQQPIFVFFHSTDCNLCIEMMKVVDEVLPEYENKVDLVDVNVYDEANQNLLVRAQIRAIPTQLFFDTNGEITTTAGLMSSDELREALDRIAGE